MILPQEIIDTVFEYLDIEQIIDNYEILSDYFLREKISCYPEFTPKTFNEMLIYRKYCVFKPNNKIFDKYDHNMKMPSITIYGTPAWENHSVFQPINLLEDKNIFQGNLWKNDSAMPLEESQTKFNELNSMYNFNSMDNTTLNLNVDGRYIKNGYIYNYKVTHLILLNKVLKQLQEKLNTFPKITTTFNGNFGKQASFQNQEPVSESIQLTIVEYLKKYKNFRNTDKSFNIKKIDPLVKEIGFNGSIINEINEFGLPKALESVSCKSEKYKIKSESANLIRVIKDTTIEFTKSECKGAPLPVPVQPHQLHNLFDFLNQPPAPPQVQPLNNN